VPLLILKVVVVEETPQVLIIQPAQRILEKVATAEKLFHVLEVLE
jgi:hypothetical protein